MQDRLGPVVENEESRAVRIENRDVVLASKGMRKKYLV